MHIVTHQSVTSETLVGNTKTQHTENIFNRLNIKKALLFQGKKLAHNNEVSDPLKNSGSIIRVLGWTCESLAETERSEADTITAADAAKCSHSLT